MNSLNGLQNNEVRVSVSNDVYERIYSRAKRIAAVPLENIDDVADRIMLSEAMCKISHLRQAIVIRGQVITDDEIDHLAKELLMQAYLTEKDHDAIALLNIYRFEFKTTESEKNILHDAEAYADDVLHPVNVMDAWLLGNEFIATGKVNGKVPNSKAYREMQNKFAATRCANEAKAKVVRQQAEQQLTAYRRTRIEMHLKAADLAGWTIETAQYQGEVIDFNEYKKAM